MTPRRKDTDMARNQEELPQTRRDDEPPPFKPIKAMETNIAEWQRKLSARKRLNQEINALLIEQQDLLEKHDRDTYPFESNNGAEREIYRTMSVKSRKTKTKPDVEQKGKRKGKDVDVEKKASAEA
jgi:hypothetical protein